MADDKMLAVISVIPGFGSTVLRGVGQAQAVNDLAASNDNCSSWRAFHTNAKNLARFDHLRNVHACLLVKIVDDSAVAWCRKRGATVFYDVLDNLGALHQLITLPPDQHLAVRFDVDVVLTQTQKLAGRLGAHRAATLYHHQTNPGVVVPLERTRAEACLVGFMAGNKHNKLKKKTLEKLRRAMWTAAAGPPGHAARRIVFRVVEQGLDRDNSAAHLQRKDFKLPPSGSRSYWGGAAKCTGAPLPSEGSYEATPQAIFHDASAITAVDIALLWPPDSKGETMERPPTRLLYWLSHGVPAVVFGGYRSYAEIATAHNYSYLDPVTGKARLPLVRRAEEVTQVVRDLLQSATARLRLRKVGLEIAARYTALEVARRLTAILDQYCSRSIRSSEGSSSEGSKGSNSSSSSSSSESKISRGDATGDGVEEPRRQPLESTSLPMTPTRDVNRRRQAPYDVLVSDAGLSPPASAATAAAAAAEAPPCVTPPLPPFELSGESEKPTVTVDLVTSCGGSSEMASLCVSVEKNRQNAARIMRSSFKTTPYAVAVNVVNVSNTTWPCLSAESALPKFALLRNIMTQRRNEFEGNANLRHHKHLIFWTDSDASFSNGANAPAIYRSLVKVSLRYHLVASHDKPTFPFLLCLGAFLLDVSPWSVQFVEAMLESGAARPTSIAIPNQDEHMYHAALRREASGGRLKARWRNHNYNHEIPPNILNWESCLAVENRSLLHSWVCRISLLKDQRFGLMFDCCWPEQSRINNLLLKTRAVISYVNIDERVTSTRFGEVAILPAAVLNGRLNQSSSFSSTSLIIHMAGNQKSGLFEMVKEQFQAHLYAS